MGRSSLSSYSNLPFVKILDGFRLINLLLGSTLNAVCTRLLYILRQTWHPGFVRATVVNQRSEKLVYHHHHHHELGHAWSVPSSWRAQVCWSRHLNCGRPVFGRLFGLYVNISFGSASLPIVQSDISTVVRILEFYYLIKNVQFFLNFSTYLVFLQKRHLCSSNVCFLFFL
jgi:hypothetical protein